MNSSDTKNHPDELESDSTAPSTPEEDETVLEKEPAGPLDARPAVAQSLSVSMALSRQLATAPIIQAMEAVNRQLATAPIIQAMEAVNRQLATAPIIQAMEAVNRQLATAPIIQTMEALNRQVAINTFSESSLKRLDTLEVVLAARRVVPIVPPVIKRKHDISLLASPRVSPDVDTPLKNLTKEDLGIEKLVSGHQERTWLILYDYLISNSNLRCASRKLFADGHYALAVEQAYKCLDNTVNTKSGLHEKYGAKLMQEAFSPQNPVLRLNGLQSRSERDEQLGYMEIFAGVMTGIRNPRAHNYQLVDEPEKALELLVLANHLMRMLERSSPAT